METSSIVLTCINVSYAKKIGSLVSTENARVKIIETAKIRNDEIYGRLMSSSLDANFKYHMDNKCYKNYVHKKALERVKVSFFADF